VAVLAFVYGGANPIGVRAQVYFSDPHGSFTDESEYCLLCHDIHQAPGQDLIKSEVESAVCFTCHNGTASNNDIQVQLNLDNTTNAMHPVAVNLPNNDGVYQDAYPRTTAGIAPPGPYKCSQCHDPHGATGYARNLRSLYDVNEYVTYPASPDPYTFCWSCHDVGKIVNDETLFGKHKDHIQSKSSPCSACHYGPHGVPYGKLVNFNPAFVMPSGVNPSPVYTDLGPQHGSCTLSCHGKDHQNTTY
jgi:predicted CXXCH cytochrome family protein